MKCNEDQFNVFEFFDLLIPKLENVLTDILFLLNNLTYNICEFNKLMIEANIFEDLFFIASFNKGKKLYKYILVFIDEFYSKSATLTEDLLSFNKHLKFKDLISEIILNYKDYDLETTRFALNILRELLFHLKNLENKEHYIEAKSYFDLNNICIMIEKLTLVDDSDIANCALLIEKENWSVIEIYSCHYNNNMRNEY